MSYCLTLMSIFFPMYYHFYFDVYIGRVHPSMGGSIPISIYYRTISTWSITTLV